MSRSNIAIVVPVRGDLAALTGLIDRIRSWSDQPREIVVVAADPDERLAALCAARDCRYLESVRNRGRQLDEGAQASASPELWFLHADAAPHPSSLGAIASCLAEGAEGGFFRFAFAGSSSWRKSLLAGLVNLRVGLGGIPYGDQGLFVRRKAYLECGGFDHQPLFEEVSLVRKLRSRGHFRGLELPIGVAPRRWERDGWWRRSLTNRWLALRYLLGTSAERLAASYDSEASAREGPRN